MKPRTTVLWVLLTLTGMATADPAVAGPWMQTGAAAIPPGGFLGFCVRHLQECRGNAPEATAAALTEERWRDLWSVQAKINSEIVPREDPTHVWDYPTNGHGDCNKF